MKKILLISTALLIAPLMASATYADEYEDEVLALLQTSNVLEPLQDMMDRMLTSMGPTMVMQLQTAFEKEGKDVAKADIEELVVQYKEQVVLRFGEEMKSLMVDEYRKFFTLEEVKAVHELMKRPEFMVFTEKMPQVMASSQAAGQALGRKIGQEVMTELLQDNPKFK